MKEHVLKQGESLVKLSVLYEVPVCMIVRANNYRDPKDISTGNIVLIPPSDYCMCAEEKLTHLVQEEDTVFAISCKYGVPMRSILKENGLGAHDLTQGMVLSIPPKPAGMLMYNSKMGENYEAVAKKFSVSVEELVRINGANMYPGMQVYVPL